MEQIVILVILGCISLINWLIQRSAELREQRKRQEIPESNPFLSTVPTPHQDRTEEMHKLMEALGVTMEEPTPSLPKQSPAPPSQTLPPLPAFEQLPAKEKPPIRARLTSQIPRRDSLVSSSVIWEQLRSHSSIRQAVVLREILGPPKAL